MTDDLFSDWCEALEKRHTANLTFQEVRRAVQALSVIYVEQRTRLESGAALDGAGKRAAFAMFYAPLHFLLVREVVRALKVAAVPPPSAILDLGCGTGIAGAAWALESDPRAKLIGCDRNSWALQECKWTYKVLGLAGTPRSLDLKDLKIPSHTGIIAAFTINELHPEMRDKLLSPLLQAAHEGAPVLIVEPIARRLTDWWDEWALRFRSAGGREDTWRFPVKLPGRLALMDRAAGLNHHQLTGRSLWINTCCG